MISVRFSHVAFSYCDPVEVFTDVSLQVGAGWTGIVGDNGGGKSTLLRLIAGELVPSRGSVAIEPTGTHCHLCPQRVDDVSAEVHSFANTWTRAAVRWQRRLALDPGDLERWPTLSPGERKRWQIGAALAMRPDVLLLDEPTNHVDSATRELLLTALARFRGLGLVVSHDRELLATITTATVRVHEARVTLYRGSYQQAKDQWETAARAQRDAYDRTSKRARRLVRRLHEQRHQRAGAEAARSTRARSKGPRDSDARSAAAKARVRNAEATLARSVAVSRRAADRATQNLEQLSVTKERGRSLFIGYEPARKPRLLALNAAPLNAGTHLIHAEVHAAVLRESRVHLCGRNGAGKTTLLEAMIAAAVIPRERLLYLPQVLERPEIDELWERTRTLDRQRRGQVLNAAAALGMDPQRALASASPSPGEARKLWLAWGLGLHAWILMLDEPTNHLDLPSRERLQTALQHYPGALVLVSHDRAFAEPLTSTVWTLDSSGLRMS